MILPSRSETNTNFRLSGVNEGAYSSSEVLSSDTYSTLAPEKSMKGCAVVSGLVTIST
ncbi:MAG TPA: hypothetical protein PLQ21_05470 [Candidatus Kapabacteria bacterium]|nr:hypothetical protein [Candidatus Kapabacteria bacterium]